MIIDNRLKIPESRLSHLLLKAATIRGLARYIEIVIMFQSAQFAALYFSSSSGFKPFVIIVFVLW